MRAQLPIALATVASVVSATGAVDKFDWDAITPAQDLEYHDCYDQFKCARLLVPLDWQDEKSGQTIALAIIKQDSVVDIDDPTYGGPVISNPGGPGGSGTASLVRSAALQRNFLDTPGKKHFELVSFDPRGVGRTTPQVNCYPTSRLERTAAALETRGNHGLNGGPVALAYGLGLAEIEGGRCADANGDLLMHVGTASVARDMLAIVDKIDEYNKKNSKRGAGAKMGAATKDLPRLQYLGVSYGTVLGNYFASMFPERIGRLVLDGVFDIDDYNSGDGWLTNTADTDKLAKNFFDGCFNAGRQTCPLVRDGDKSGSDTEKRVWDWAKGLDESPVLASHGGKFAVMQSQDIRWILFNGLYSPLQAFKPIATAINNAMTGGDTAAVYDYIATASGGPLDSACAGDGHINPDALNPDAQHAILCSDGADISGRNMTFWRGYVDKQLAQSSLVGDIWPLNRISCSNWKTRAKWQFHGPFTTPEPSKLTSAPEPGRPAAPIFFLSNRLDPVTPLGGAQKVAKKYPGASLLIQETMGHTAFGAHKFTNCTTDLVRQYMDEGVVPAKETSCEAACDPWAAQC